jgi:proteasome lid subunit RPN8/RPN11
LTEFISQLFIPEPFWQEMIYHVQVCLPEEACGLLGGDFASAVSVEALFLVDNQLHSPVKFRMDPAGQLHAMLALEERNLDLIAIFHSHPNGPELPSLTDQAEFYYPGVLSLIFSPTPDRSGWQARAFHLSDGHSIEVPVIRG